MSGLAAQCIPRLGAVRCNTQDWMEMPLLQQCSSNHGISFVAREARALSLPMPYITMRSCTTASVGAVGGDLAAIAMHM